MEDMNRFREPGYQSEGYMMTKTSSSRQLSPLSGSSTLLSTSLSIPKVRSKMTAAQYADGREPCSTEQRVMLACIDSVERSGPSWIRRPYEEAELELKRLETGRLHCRCIEKGAVVEEGILTLAAAVREKEEKQAKGQRCPCGR